MREDNIVRLRHMLDAANEAVGFVQGLTRTDLNSDRKLVLALVKDIEIIGEAAFQISQTARKQAPNIPWHDNIGAFHLNKSGAMPRDLRVDIPGTLHHLTQWEIKRS